jgi:hypothetical protein
MAPSIDMGNTIPKNASVVPLRIILAAARPATAHKAQKPRDWAVVFAPDPSTTTHPSKKLAGNSTEIGALADDQLKAIPAAHAVTNAAHTRQCIRTQFSSYLGSMAYVTREVFHLPQLTMTSRLPRFGPSTTQCSPGRSSRVSPR